MKNPFLVGKKIYLRSLEYSDLEGNYISWFNDAEICKNNSHYVFPYTRQAAEEYIRRVNNSKEDLVLAIIQKKDDLHIGNISLQEINYISRSAELAIMFGDKSCWGKGYSKEASVLLMRHGFIVLNLHRIYGGTSCENILSRLFVSFLGMVKEGCRREAMYKNGKFVDIIEYGILKSEFLEKFGSN